VGDRLKGKETGGNTVHHKLEKRPGGSPGGDKNASLVSETCEGGV